MSRTKAERVDVINSEQISKKAVKHSLQTFWGPEPTWNPLSTEKEFEEEISKAFGWYNAMIDEGHKKSYLEQYCTKYIPESFESIKGISEKLFESGPLHTAAILARCQVRGAKLPDKWVIHIADTVKTCTKKNQNKEETKDIGKPVYVPRDPRINEFIGVIDGLLDDFGLSQPKKAFPSLSMSDSVLKAGATNAQRAKVYDHFETLIEELKSLAEGKADKETIECYPFPKSSIKKVYGWLTGEASENLVLAAKKVRKVRKKKIKSPAQILKKFTSKDRDPDLGVKSIDPEYILGAEQLWVYNCKTRKLGVYYAKTDKGLGVAGKSIIDYDEEKSNQKKLRKPKEIVPNVVGLGKVALRKILTDVRAVPQAMKGLVGKDTIILRAIK